MLRSTLFRDKALVRSAEPEPVDGLLRVTAPHEWMLVVALAVALLAAVLWSTFGTLERTVSRQGILVHPGDRHSVTAVFSGIVTEALAVPGERVEAGQTLGRLKASELDGRLRIARARVALLKDRARRAGNSAGPGLDAELAAARSESIELAALIAAGEAILSPQAGVVSASALSPGRKVTAGESLAEVRVASGASPEAIVLGAAIGCSKVADGHAGARFGRGTVAAEQHRGDRHTDLAIAGIHPFVA